MVKDCLRCSRIAVQVALGRSPIEAANDSKLEILQWKNGDPVSEPS